MSCVSFPRATATCRRLVFRASPSYDPAVQALRTLLSCLLFLGIMLHKTNGEFSSPFLRGATSSGSGSIWPCASRSLHPEGGAHLDLVLAARDRPRQTASGGAVVQACDRPGRRPLAWLGSGARRRRAGLSGHRVSRPGSAVRPEHHPSGPEGRWRSVGPRTRAPIPATRETAWHNTRVRSPPPQ